MCLEIRKDCNCGKNHAFFNLGDNILIPEAIANLYCPECSREIDFRADTMLNDNGWVIEYDIVLAQALLREKLQVEPGVVTPEFIFDKGYATWREMYPGEHEDIKEEKEKIVAILKEDPKRYFLEMRRWANARMERMKRQGWRRAINA